MPVAIRDLRFRRRVRTLEPDELETQRNDITFIICFFFFFLLTDRNDNFST